MPCSIGNGMGTKNSNAGLRKLRTGSRIWLACSIVPG